MAFPDELLTEDETIVLHRHPHWKMLVVPVLIFLITVGAAFFAAALIRDQGWYLWGWIALAVIGVTIVLWFTVGPLLRWRTTHFVLTSRRVLVREGILVRQGVDIPMSRINSVQFRHTIIERMLGCGTLTIESASDEPLEFDDIPQVEKVHTLLYREVVEEQ